MPVGPYETDWHRVILVHFGILARRPTLPSVIGREVCTANFLVVRVLVLVASRNGQCPGHAQSQHDCDCYIRAFHNASPYSAMKIRVWDGSRNIVFRLTAGGTKTTKRRHVGADGRVGPDVGIGVNCSSLPTTGGNGQGTGTGGSARSRRLTRMVADGEGGASGGRRSVGDGIGAETTMDGRASPDTESGWTCSSQRRENGTRLIEARLHRLGRVGPDVGIGVNCSSLPTTQRGRTGGASPVIGLRSFQRHRRLKYPRTCFHPRPHVLAIIRPDRHPHLKIIVGKPR